MSSIILDELYQWSKDQQLWQQDALRRTLSSEKISDETVAQLSEICAAENGLDVDGVKMPTALDKNDFGSVSNDDNQVSLETITNVENANALAQGQTLSFGTKGLTMLYGDNGTGKSGYSRILKKACRARGATDKILPDVFKSNTSSPAKADISYIEGNQKKLYGWVDGVSAESPLKKVSVFDSDSASVHITEANDVAFSPFGLDILPKLADTYKKIQDNLKRKQMELQSEPDIFQKNPEVREGTQLFTFLKNELNGASISSEVVARFQLDEDENKRILELKKILSEDPNELATKKEQALSKVENLRAVLSKLEVHFKKAPELSQSHRRYEDSNAAAQIASEDLFSNEPLKVDAGSHQWRAFWEAARKYSEEIAYPDKNYPVTDPNSKCVLCHQTLEEPARDRLSRFEAYVKNETALKAKNCEHEFRTILTTFKSIPLTVSKHHSGFQELLERSPKLAKDVQRFIVAVNIFLRKVQLWKPGLEIPPFTKELMLDHLAFEELIAKERDSILSLRKLVNSEERERYQRELIELQAKNWASSASKEIESEIIRRRKLKSISEAIRKCNTRTITDKSKELTSKYISSAIKDSFVNELNELGFRAIKISIEEESGAYGSMLFQIRLKEAQVRVNCGQVLSEGEQKCIALAGFMTELATDNSNSALVFDDPVSSLDHKWRRRVAKRLVKEARLRQVIIFTHDLVFFHLLSEMAEKESVDIHASHLDRSKDKTGMCLDGVPWTAMLINKRIAYLNGKAQDAEKVYNEHGYETYRPTAEQLYGRLRKAWERAIEEVLLNKAIMRFGREVQTKRLRVITDISDDDIKLIDDEMSKCSLYCHDQPDEAHEAPPSPEELKRDIKILKDWVNEMRTQRKRS